MRDGFNLKPGKEVSVYNVPTSMAKRRTVVEPGIYKIKERSGMLYKVVRTDAYGVVAKDTEEKPRILSRYLLQPM